MRMAGRFGRVACGGTFDMLHKGHRTFIRRAFEVGERVVIGLTTDGFVKKLGKPHPVAPYEERMKELTEFLRREGLLDRAEIVPLSNPHGPAAWNGTVDALVVSRETEPRAREINRLRVEAGLQPLEVVVVDMVLAEDGLPISTTRIRAGEIDREGRLLIHPTTKLKEGETKTHEFTGKEI